MSFIGFIYYIFILDLSRFVSLYGIIFITKGETYMDWKLQLGISIVVPIISSLLTYLAAIKKSKNDVEAVKISAENEIKKIREESDKELKRIQKETDEQIRLKIAENDLISKTNEEQIKNAAASKFMEGFMKDPKKSAESLKAMQEVAKMFQSNK